MIPRLNTSRLTFRQFCELALWKPLKVYHWRATVTSTPWCLLQLGLDPTKPGKPRFVWRVGFPKYTQNRHAVQVLTHDTAVHYIRKNRDRPRSVRYREGHAQLWYRHRLGRKGRWISRPCDTRYSRAEYEARLECQKVTVGWLMDSKIPEDLYGRVLLFAGLFNLDEALCHRIPGAPT